MANIRLCIVKFSLMFTIDFMSLFPWKMGRVLVWDATDLVHHLKKQNFLNIRRFANEYGFIPFAVETLGLWDLSVI